MGYVTAWVYQDLISRGVLNVISCAAGSTKHDLFTQVWFVFLASLWDLQYVGSSAPWLSSSWRLLPSTNVVPL